MENADNKDTSQQSAVAADIGKVESELAKVTEQIAQMNQGFQQQFQALANAVRPQKQEVTISDDDIYEPQKLQQKILQQANQMTNQILAETRKKDAMIYTLAQDYPEIQSNSEVRKAVLEAQQQIPEAIRDTAEGYEMAVLKAVSKAGLIPKSKRKSIDDDVSFGGGSGGESRRATGPKKKVTDNMVRLAQLLGRDTSDPKVMKGLEEAANRDSWTKYR